MKLHKKANYAILTLVVIVGLVGLVAVLMLSNSSHTPSNMAGNGFRTLKVQQKTISIENPAGFGDSSGSSSTDDCLGCCCTLDGSGFAEANGLSECKDKLNQNPANLFFVETQGSSCRKICADYQPNVNSGMEIISDECGEEPTGDVPASDDCGICCIPYYKLTQTIGISVSGQFVYNANIGVNKITTECSNLTGGLSSQYGMQFYPAYIRTSSEAECQAFSNQSIINSGSTPKLFNNIPTQTFGIPLVTVGKYSYFSSEDCGGTPQSNPPCSTQICCFEMMQTSNNSTTYFLTNEANCEPTVQSPYVAVAVTSNYETFNCKNLDVSVLLDQFPMKPGQTYGLTQGDC